MLRFRKFPVSKKFGLESARGKSRFSVENIFSRGRKFSYVKHSVLCSKRFPVAKILKIREGEYQRFPSKSFCLTVRKSSFRRGFHECFINFGYRESLWIREVDINIFNRIFFCLTVPKKFVREHFCAMFQKTNGGKKDYEEVGKVKILPGNITVSQCRKLS